MREAKEAEVGRREVLLGGLWAVVRVARRVRRSGRYECMVIQSLGLGIVVLDTVVR